MPESTYNIITLVGTSDESWEKAAAFAVETAAKSLRDLRVVEIEELDMQLENGKVTSYRAKVRVSFKYEGKKYTCLDGVTVFRANLSA
jgi:flavin-binding protein dodecin